MTRFVLLRHECPADYRDGSHWDLMLERPGVEREHRLATWSLLTLPRAWASAVGVLGGTDQTIAATELPDHRAWYLDHEGPLETAPGSVARVAGGECEWRVVEANRYEATLLGSSPFEGVARFERDENDAWAFAWRTDIRQ